MEGKKEFDLEKPKKKVVGLPKYYAYVCFERPEEYSDYSKNFSLSYGYFSRFSHCEEILIIMKFYAKLGVGGMRIYTKG